MPSVVCRGGQQTAWTGEAFGGGRHSIPITALLDLGQVELEEVVQPGKQFLSARGVSGACNAAARAERGLGASNCSLPERTLTLPC